MQLLLMTTALLTLQTFVIAGDIVPDPDQLDLPCFSVVNGVGSRVAQATKVDSHCC